MRGLLVIIKKPDILDDVVYKLEELEIKDISIVSSAAVNEAEEKKEVSFLGSFRKFLDLYYNDEKLVLAFVKEDEIEKVREGLKDKLKSNIKEIKVISFNFEEVIGMKDAS